MKETRSLVKRAGVCGSTLGLALMVGVSLSLTSLAAPPDGRGGGKGSGGGDEEPPADTEIAAPIAPDSAVSYVATKFEWEIEAENTDPEFIGVWVDGISSSGLAVGNVKRPPSARPDISDPLGQGERRAVINAKLVEGTYIVDHVMRDLNVLFAEALAGLNSSRPETVHWRLAYARDINEAGQIVCQLIPDNHARGYTTTDAANYEGVEPVPLLHAVADLRSLTLAVLDGGAGYDQTHPNRAYQAMNENGDVYLFAWIPEVGNTNDFFANEDGTYVLDSDLLPADWDDRLTFNSFRDFGYSDRTPANGQKETVTLQRRVNGVDESLWSFTSRNYARFTPLGISEGGSVYTTTVNFEEREIPYHVKSPTERIRIADTDCSGEVNYGRPSLSRAQVEGEEQLVILDYETNPSAAEYYVYKPNFEARHRIVFSDPLTGATDVVLSDSFAGGTMRQVLASPPIDGGTETDPFEGEPYSGTYNGGYLTFTYTLGPEFTNVSYLLEPVPAP